MATNLADGSGSRPETGAATPIEARVKLGFVVDPWLTLGHLQHGRWDPSVRIGREGIWRATRTPEGLATVRLVRDGSALSVSAWGPGGGWAVVALPRLLGAEDDPDAFEPRHAVLRDLARRWRGLRFGRSDTVYEALVPAVIEQKVTGIEASRSYRALLRRYGERAPGPVELFVVPAPERLAGIPAYAFHPLGLEERRAETLRRVARVAPRLEAAAELPAEAALAALQAVRGVGPWTAAEAARAAFGDPDAVSVGDFHLPHVVCWALAGELRGDDARMLELLEPYRGQRARAVRLLELAGITPPRRAPRMPIRSIARL